MTHHILVVEDDAAVRSIIADALTDAGWHVVTAENGHDALEEVRVSPPCLIVLDLWMPVLDGRAFERELRLLGHDIPILVVSAVQEARPWAASIGVAGYLPKPFRLDDLTGLVSRIVRDRA